MTLVDLSRVMSNMKYIVLFLIFLGLLLLFITLQVEPALKALLNKISDILL